MRIILSFAFLSSLALAGCKSEEQRKVEFRQQFLSQCAAAVRAQPSPGPDLNADTVCTCVSDKVFAGKTPSEMERLVNDQTAVTNATAECVMQQMQQTPDVGATPTTGAVAESVGEAADDAE